VLGVALLALLPALTSCKKNLTTPPVPRVLAPEAQHRDLLVATVTLRSVENTLVAAGEVATEAQLPFDAGQLRVLIIARSGVPEALLGKLDLHQPLGMAFIGRGKGNSPFSAAAATAKSANDAKQLITTLGQKVSEKQGATQVKTSEGTDMWILAEENVLVASDSFEGLVAAGAHALAARQVKGDDLEVLLYPEAMARADGTDLETALANFKAGMIEETRKNARTKKPALMEEDAAVAYMSAMLDFYFDFARQSEAIGVSLAVGKDRGLVLRGALRPRNGSELARRIKTPTPYKLAPSMTEGPPPVMLSASHIAPWMVEPYEKMLAALEGSKVPGIRPMVQGGLGLMRAMRGHVSGRVNLDAKGFEYSWVADVSAETKPDDLMASIEKTLGPDGMGTMFKTLEKSPQPGNPGLAYKFSRKGDTARTEMKFKFSKKDVKEAEALRAFLGSDGLTFVTRVSDGKLLFTTEPGADARLTALGATAPTTVHPEMQQVLDETRGEEGFFYVDLLGFIRQAATTIGKSDPSAAQASAMLSFLPGIDKLRVPLLFTFRGGDQLTAQMKIPMRTFKGVGTVAGPLLGAGMGQGMGGALAPAP
jgi:hypothetical protein